jgi:prephenate dehydrogenase
MPVQVTILGLGQIGGSVGLALAEHKNLVYRVGHDREIGIARKAEKMGAIDKVEINIPNAVEKADFVVLSLPINQIQEMFSIIAPYLKENAVVMDTAPVKEPVIGWAKEVFSEMHHYIGLVPIINPKYLQDHDTGITAALTCSKWGDRYCHSPGIPQKHCWRPI